MDKSHVDPAIAGAWIDATGCYRYRLWRHWDGQRPTVGFVLLNPSRADATQNDPTIRRCLGFARSWGYGGLEVTNLFAYRAVQPHLLRQVADPVGAENDRVLQTLGDRVDRIILAWGNGGSLYHRDRTVLSLLPMDRVDCLGLTRSGYPRHPLYLRAHSLPHPFSPPT